MVTNPTVATAQGKIIFAAKQTNRNTPNVSGAYTASNAIFLNTPAIPVQPIRKVNSRQQTNSFSRRSPIPVGYAKGVMSFDVPIKPAGAGALGDLPHGNQLLEAWWGKVTVDPGVSVIYEPLVPSIGVVYPAYTILVKYGHEVFLLINCVVPRANINGVSDGSENVVAALTGDIEFTRMYWVGKDELSGTEATGQTVISIKDARKFAYGFSSSPAVQMKVAFRTVAGVVDDNSGAGYALTAVDTGANTITISPALAGAGLAADDIVYGFVPTPVDSGVEIGFHIGPAERGVDGSEDPITLVSMNYVMENPFIKILENEKSGTGEQYPTRIVDAGGTGALRIARAEIEFIENEDDTNLRYISEQQVEWTLTGYWGNTAGERFYIKLNQAELDAPEKSGDQEIHTNIAYVAFGEGEAKMVFD